MKRISAIFAAGVILFFFSCGSGGNEKEENKAGDTTAATTVAAPAFTPFKIFMIEHHVKNFDKWRPVYLAHDSLRQAYGITKFVTGRGLDDSNMVFVLDKISDVQKAKEFAALPFLKDAMKNAGVTGQPAFSYFDVVRNDDTPIDQKDRILMVIKVKDFDAWLKVFDGEKESRTANGMLDRGIGRGVDDSTMLYLAFVVTDLSKAKARIASPELKKIMTDSGVEGAPKVYYYRLVD